MKYFRILISAFTLLLIGSKATIHSAEAQVAYRLVVYEGPNNEGSGPLSPIGDIDPIKDGVPDFAIRESGWANPAVSGIRHGRVIFISGIDLTEIDRIESVVNLEGFGQYVVGLHNLDEDPSDYPEILIGAPAFFQTSGRTEKSYIYSGDDLTLYSTLLNAGYDGIRLTDLDGDSDSDDEFFIIREEKPQSGYKLFSGEPSPITLQTFSLPSPGQDLRSYQRVFNAGDMNADGYEDWITVYSGNSSAVIQVFSGATQQPVSSALPIPGGFSSVAALGDIDGVAGDEIAIGTSDNSTGGTVRFVTADSSFNLTIEATKIDNPQGPVNGSFFGSGILAVEDIDGDSITDLMVLSSRSVAGPEYNKIYFYSMGNRASSNSLIFELPVLRDIESISTNKPAQLGDLDGDGRSEIGFYVTRFGETPGGVNYILYSGAGESEVCAPGDLKIENERFLSGQVKKERQGSISVGKSVDPSLEDGEVVVGPSGDLELQSNVKVSIEEGFRIEEGGAFKANAGSGLC